MFIEEVFTKEKVATQRQFKNKSFRKLEKAAETV